MYIKKSNFGIWLALAAIVGFGASFLYNGTTDDLTEGDISKAIRFSNVKEDPELAVIEEKLRNDEAFYNSTKMSMDYLKNRVGTLETLSERTLAICQGVPEFESQLNFLRSLNAKACNTSKSLETAASCLDLLAEGKKAPAYEQASNNAYVGYSKIRNQMMSTKQFVEVLNSYLAANPSEENKELSGLSQIWTLYCAQDAAMSGSAEDIKYWKGKVSDMASALAAGEELSDKQLRSDIELGGNMRGLEVIAQNLAKNFDDLAEGPLKGVADELTNGAVRNDIGDLTQVMQKAFPESGVADNVLRNDLGLGEIGAKNTGDLSDRSGR
ncbi:MAG: hypothetical protein KBT00_07565 [Bacteroidales bacterium]|nr:hypothetical protein [Candidatus Cacconaster merdequi]